jgi:hypothetical protein
MPHYQAYGLTLASQIELPELLGARAQDMLQSADVTIEIVADMVAPQTGPEMALSTEAGWTQISPFSWSARDSFYLIVPDIAHYKITDGTHISVCPAPGIDDASVRVFLLGSALGALLFQRGLLVLHGNAVVIDGHAMLCLGPSGAGKSTLAAAFAARGYTVLADDVVAIDAQCAALPGIPRVKLWQDAATRLQIDTQPLARIRPALEKFNLPLPAQPVRDPVPVGWIYLLGTSNKPEFSLSPVAGLARFQPLMMNTYRRRFMEGMALHPVHLTRCGELAGRAHLAYASRPKQGFDIDGLVDHLLADIARHPPRDAQ